MRHKSVWPSHMSAERLFFFFFLFYSLCCPLPPFASAGPQKKQLATRSGCMTKSSCMKDGRPAGAGAHAHTHHARAIHMRFFADVESLGRDEAGFGRGGSSKKKKPSGVCRCIQLPAPTTRRKPKHTLGFGRAKYTERTKKKTESVDELAGQDAAATAEEKSFSWRPSSGEDGFHGDGELRGRFTRGDPAILFFDSAFWSSTSLLLHSIMDPAFRDRDAPVEAVVDRGAGPLLTRAREAPFCGLPYHGPCLSPSF